MTQALLKILRDDLAWLSTCDPCREREHIRELIVAEIAKLGGDDERDVLHSVRRTPPDSSRA